MECIGDPYGGPHASCSQLATHFVFGAIADDNGDPVQVMMPTCRLHQNVIGEWVASSPLGESVLIGMAEFWTVHDKCEREYGSVLVASAA